MKSASLLLIDDDEELAGMLAEYLGREGFACTLRHDGRSGLEAAITGDHALVILDVMMPGMDGIAVLEQLRQHTDVPVIMLTARGDDADRIAGLELGADDYVPKPCTPRELCARIHAILRRTRIQVDANAQHEVLNNGDLVLWPQARQAIWQEKPLKLTSTEFSLLEILLRHVGTPVSRETLSTLALGKPLSRFDRSIDMHISSIRRKLGSLPDGQPCIIPIIRKGYQLVIQRVP